nr:hypothetical protein [Pirellula sp.]
FATLIGTQINGKLYVTVKALQINFSLFRKILQNVQTSPLARFSQLIPRTMEMLAILSASRYDTFSMTSPNT